MELIGRIWEIGMLGLLALLVIGWVLVMLLHTLLHPRLARAQAAAFWDDIKFPVIFAGSGFVMGYWSTQTNGWNGFLLGISYAVFVMYLYQWCRRGRSPLRDHNNLLIR